MGNFCCKKPEDELVLETFEATEQSNIKTIEKEFNDKEVKEVKDKYPHDSDSAFKRKKYEQKENSNINEFKQEVEPIIDEDIKNE